MGPVSGRVCNFNKQIALSFYYYFITEENRRHEVKNSVVRSLYYKSFFVITNEKLLWIDVTFPDFLVLLFFIYENKHIKYQTDVLFFYCNEWVV